MPTALGDPLCQTVASNTLSRHQISFDTDISQRCGLKSSNYHASFNRPVLSVTRSLVIACIFNIFQQFRVKITTSTKIFFFSILANGSYFSQDCKQIKKIKFLLFLNIKSNFIYINILHCYCVDKCEMYYIIKIRTLKCTIIYWFSCGI